MSFISFCVVRYYKQFETTGQCRSKLLHLITITDIKPLDLTSNNIVKNEMDVEEKVKLK
jgi:hypothetical protein